MIEDSLKNNPLQQRTTKNYRFLQKQAFKETHIKISSDITSYTTFFYLPHSQDY